MTHVAIDLHMHSYYSSDGEFSPTELMERCVAAGLKVASLTDHNSIKGLAEADKKGKELGLTVIPGVELNCVCEDTHIHLLGYCFSNAEAAINELESDIARQEHETAQARMQQFHALGIEFDDEKTMALAKESVSGAVSSELLAEVIIADPRNKDNQLIKPYLPGGSRSENPYVNFYWDLCAPDKLCYYPIHYPSFKDANKLILDHGGITVIAHPAMTVKQDEAMIKHMVDCGVSGLEVYSTYHSQQDIKYYLGIAKRLGLMTTIGSDFHGKIKPTIELGQVPGNPDEAKLIRELKI